jgi:CheY-like chemotaxis protein
VRADFRKAKQVLINLVGNAVKFTPSGTITVRATEHADLGYWMFEVVDTGIGIPLDRQAQVFEKFIQADGSTTRTYGGTGLGLAISRSLVELMGGVIGLESEGDGKGTRMYFSLPIWRPDAEVAGAEPHVADRIVGPAGGPVVLVVEDDSAFRQFVTTMLHKHGYRTVEANHAEGGWMLARRLRPAIVVLDYALTCAEGATLRTGWDLADRMSQDEITRNIPLVFVSGFDRAVLPKLGPGTPDIDPLRKPIDAGALMSRIDQLLGAIRDLPVRVLMADDDPTMGAYVRKVLPESRFHIEFASNGDECLHVLRAQPKGFDILLLDLRMPGANGYDVLRKLNGDFPDLLVLVLTQFPEAETEDERRLLAQPAVLDVLPKASVHDHPMILPHIIDWHLQVRRGRTPGSDGRPSDRNPESNWGKAA